MINRTTTYPSLMSLLFDSAKEKCCASMDALVSSVNEGDKGGSLEIFATEEETMVKGINICFYA